MLQECPAGPCVCRARRGPSFVSARPDELLAQGKQQSCGAAGAGLGQGLVQSSRVLPRSCQAWPRNRLKVQVVCKHAIKARPEDF